MIEHPDWYDVKAKDYQRTVPLNVTETSSFNQLVKSCATLRRSCELMHMFAISAALGEPMQSFCPPGSNSMPHPYTMRVVGRDVIDRPRHEPKIVIMWTEAVAPEQAASLHPNHFVCLIRPTSSTQSASHNCNDKDDDRSCGDMQASSCYENEEDCTLNSGEGLCSDNDVASCDGVSVNSGHEDVDDGCGEFDERGSSPRNASSIQDMEQDDSDGSMSSVAMSSMVEREEASCRVNVNCATWDLKPLPNGRRLEADSVIRMLMEVRRTFCFPV
jgi:hypothetical protein